MSQVRAELRRQHPETRKAWLEGEMDSMNHKTSHLGKPSVRDCCKYLNLGVRDDKEISVKNLVENLMSEIGHVVEAASASSGVAPCCGQEVRANSACVFDATRAARAKQLVTVPIQTIVAQKEQGWDAISCGHCSVLETFNCKTRRRMASPCPTSNSTS